MIIQLILVISLAAQGRSQFSVFTKGQTAHLHLTQGETVAYNKNITSLGAHFSSPGVYQCRISGLYAFHFYSLSHSNSKIWLELFKNMEYIVSIFAYTSQDYADAGNSVILHLQEGDEVYVKAHDAYDNTLFGQADEIYTTFTGVLIQADARSNVPRVAFSAGLSDHQHLSQGETVLYDKVITNYTGHGLQNGTFTAPISGTYIFHYHSLSQNDKIVWLELFHNDMYVNSVYAHTSNGYADAGNTAILHLSKGDVVYVKGHDASLLDMFGTPDQVYSTFSGVLLAPTYDEGSDSAFVGDSEEEISFSAGLTHQLSGSQMVFDRIFSNLRRGFDQNTGVFTAPKSGVYVFHYHALSTSTNVIWVELYHNYRYVDSLYGHSSVEFAAGSNSAVLNLINGDTVYLKIRDPSSSYFGAPDQIYSTFSGYFLGSVFDSHPIVG